MSLKLIRNCREVTALVLAGEDRRLGTGERLAIRVHLAMCDGCTNFSQHVAVMRRALARWRSDDGGDGGPPPA